MSVTGRLPEIEREGALPDQPGIGCEWRPSTANTERKMQFFDSTITEEAIVEVERVLRSGFVSEGTVVADFEKQLDRQLGLMHPVALNSGTSALHLALVIAGVASGDEVIIPPQTFIATGMAVLMQGAIPVFADVQQSTGNIAPESIREKITQRTRAVIPVHWGGYPCDLDEIHEIARQAEITVIEDAAHALGATYKGRPIGTISRFTAFSFQAIKHLTTGDGGALACREEADAHEARARRWFGIDRANSQESILGEREYDVEHLGFKYHMNNVAAAIGLGNLKSFQHVLDRHHQIVARYRYELSGVPGLALLEQKEDRSSADWFFPVLVERREDFVRKLRKCGCAVSVVHRRIDQNRVFGNDRTKLPGQAFFDKRHCTLPVHASLTDEDVGLVIAVVKEGW